MQKNYHRGEIREELSSLTKAEAFISMYGNILNPMRFIDIPHKNKNFISPKTSKLDEFVTSVLYDFQRQPFCVSLSWSVKWEITLNLWYFCLWNTHFLLMQIRWSRDSYQFRCFSTLHGKKYFYILLWNVQHTPIADQRHEF